MSSPASSRAGTPKAVPLLAVGRLLRISLSPSAIADVAAGIVLGAGLWPDGAGPWLLVLASLAVYHGGMALNDWADRDGDARTRPERPVPSGAVPPRFALGLAVLLLVAGPLLALAAAPIAGAWALGLSLCAAFYDLRGRGPWLGPSCLALCRGGNLALGIVYARAELGLAPLEPLALTAPLLYGAYVFVVSRLGRMEDAEDAAPLGRRPARLVSVACALLLVAPLVPMPAVAAQAVAPAWLASARIPLATLVCAFGAFALLRRAFRPGPWTRRDVVQTMGLALRRLLIVTSTLAVARGTETGLWVGALLLLGFPLSRALRGWFPPS